MSNEKSIKRLIELAESLEEHEQEKLACVAQGMVAVSMAAERKLADSKPA